MLGTKPFIALVLTGFGAASLGINTALPKRPAYTPAVPAGLDTVDTPAAIRPAAAPVVDRVLTLPPVTIYSRGSARVALKAPDVPTVLVPCSAWRPLESGPAGRGVTTLCVPGSAQR
jgi:hypothetical protein